MKLLCTIVICLLYIQVGYSQSKLHWIGGTPGKQTLWDEPKIWSTNRVPTGSDLVVIKSHNGGQFSTPFINEQVVVAQLEIHHNAGLHIAPKGQLIIDGTYTYSTGLSNFGGTLIVEGVIEYINISDCQESYLVNDQYQILQKQLLNTSIR